MRAASTYGIRQTTTASPSLRTGAACAQSKRGLLVLPAQAAACRQVACRLEWQVISTHTQLDGNLLMYPPTPPLGRSQRNRGRLPAACRPYYEYNGTLDYWSQQLPQNFVNGTAGTNAHCWWPGLCTESKRYICRIPYSRFLCSK
jgi:hypothetical protein